MNNNAKKSAKVALFASLIAVMILPFSSTNFAEADNYVTIKEDSKYNYIQEIIDRKDFEKSITINDIRYEQKFKTKDLGGDKYYVENSLTTSRNDDTHTKVMQYQIQQTIDGYEIEIVDQPKLKIESKGKVSAIPVGYVETGNPTKIIVEDGGEIYNGFADGSDAYSQTCWGDTNTWSMWWQADTTWKGTHSNDWSNVNWSITGEDSLYYEWCIFPKYTKAANVYVSGTGYVHSDSYYGPQVFLSGWSGAEIENPWDEINFKIEFVQGQII